MRGNGSVRFFGDAANLSDDFYDFNAFGDGIEPIDINGDGFTDLVVGTVSGITLLRRVP